MRFITLAAAAAATLIAGAASAQSLTGDTQLAYQDGVVYDDDLVPGRGVDQPYLVEEQGGSAEDTGAPSSRATVSPVRARASSPNLIGPVGRIVRY